MTPISRRHARTRPARDQQPPLLIGQIDPIGEHIREHARLFGAPSRPSDTPIPTIITDGTALPSVRHAGIRPA